MRFHDKSSAQMVCARALSIVLLASFSVFSGCTTGGKEESSIPKTYNTGTMGSDPIYTAATTTTLSSEKILDQQLQAYRYENIASVNLPDGGKLTCDQKALTYTPKGGSPKKLLSPLAGEEYAWLTLKAIAPDGKSCQINQDYTARTEIGNPNARSYKHLLLNLETGKTAEIKNNDYSVWSPDGKYLSYNNSETGVLYLLDISSMTYLDVSWLPKAAGIISFSPDSKKMVITTESGSGSLLSLQFCSLNQKACISAMDASGKKAQLVAGPDVANGGWIGNDRYAVNSIDLRTGSSDTLSLVYDVQTGKSVGSVKDQLGLDLIYATSSDAAFCLAQKDGKPVIYQTATKKVTALNTKTAWDDLYYINNSSFSRPIIWSVYEKAFVMPNSGDCWLLYTDGRTEHRVFYTQNDKGEKVFTNPMPKAVVY